MLEGCFYSESRGDRGDRCWAVLRGDVYIYRGRLVYQEAVGPRSARARSQRTNGVGLGLARLARRLEGDVALSGDSVTSYVIPDSLAGLAGGLEREADGGNDGPARAFE